MKIKKIAFGDNFLRFLSSASRRTKMILTKRRFSQCICSTVCNTKKIAFGDFRSVSAILNYTKLFVLLAGLILIFSAAVFGNQLNQARGLFYQGNTHYSEEKFSEAIADYEGVLTLGQASGAVYYNLGNAYFKQGLLGKAVLNYLRAQRLMPRDADLKSNLKFAQSLIKGGQVAGQRNWLMRVFLRLAGCFALDELCLVSAILYFALAGVVILVILVRKFRNFVVYLSWVITVALVISACLFSARFHQDIIQKQAVVITETLDCKFEPFAEATTYFTLNEGEAVVAGAQNKDWVKVRRLDGRSGWVKLSDIELL